MIPCRISRRAPDYRSKNRGTPLRSRAPGYQEQQHGGKTKNDDRDPAAISEEPPTKKPSHGSLGKQGPSGSSGGAAPAAGERQSATLEQFQTYQQRAKSTGQVIGKGIGKGKPIVTTGQSISPALVGKGRQGGEAPEDIPENLKTAARIRLDQAGPSTLEQSPYGP